MLPERPYNKYIDTLSNLKRQIAMGLDRETDDADGEFETPPMDEFLEENQTADEL